MFSDSKANNGGVFIHYVLLEKRWLKLLYGFLLYSFAPLFFFDLSFIHFLSHVANSLLYTQMPAS